MNTIGSYVFIDTSVFQEEGFLSLQARFQNYLILQKTAN